MKKQLSFSEIIVFDLYDSILTLTMFIIDLHNILNNLSTGNQSLGS